MQKLSKEILQNYQRRKSYKEKTNFINLLKEHYDINVESSGKIIKNRNIVIGDVEKAKIIFTAHYDTCAWLPFPNLCFPTNLFLYIFYTILIILCIFILITLLSTILFLLGLSKDQVEIISFISSLLICYSMLCGYPNKHNANDNTSGIITLIELMHTIKDNKDIAYVFFDNEEKGLIGSGRFKKKHFTHNKLIINFDCVGDGDNILVIPFKKGKEYTQQLLEYYKDIKNKKFVVIHNRYVYYPSDQSHFKNTIAIAAFKKKRFIGYYLDKIHTNKDTILDETNIEAIVDNTNKFVEAII